MNTLGEVTTTLGEFPGLNSGKDENFSRKFTVSKILSISSGLMVAVDLFCWAGVGPRTNFMVLAPLLPEFCSKTSFSLSRSVSASERIFSLHLRSTSKKLLEDFLLCLSDLEHHFHSGWAEKDKNPYYNCTNSVYLVSILSMKLLRRFLWQFTVERLRD